MSVNSINRRMRQTPEQLREKMMGASKKRKGIEATYNVATGWMRIVFDEKPSRETLDQLKAEGFRYRPRSRAWVAKHSYIREELLEKLAGLVEDVNIPVDYEGKAEYYQSKAAKTKGEAEELYGEAKRKMDFIPFGQPILVGHHSEKRHRKDIETIGKKMRKSFETSEKARQYQETAERYTEKAEGRENPVTILNRIEKLEKDLNKLKTYKGDEAKRMIPRIEERLRQEREKYKMSGGIIADKVEFKPGMRVWTSHGPATVKTVSKKSLRIDYDAKYLGGLRTNSKIDIKDIRDVIPEKSKYDQMIDQYTESNYDAVKVDVKNVDPDTLNRDLHRRIRERGLQDKIDASISDNTVYLEKTE